MKKICFLLIIFSLSSNVYAAISYTNGYWSTTLNAPQDWDLCKDGDTASWLNGLIAAGNGCYDPNNCHAQSYSQILTSSNYPNGGGGRGWSNFYTTAGQSSFPVVQFPNGVTEFWFRWYAKYPADFNSNKKLVYAFSDIVNGQAGPHPAINFNPYSDYARIYVYGTPYNREFRNIGVSSVYGRLGYDGQWHAYEVYFKMGNAPNTGIFRLWIDNVLLVEDTACDFYRPGFPDWSHMEVPSNVSMGGPNYCMTVDLDDFASAIPSYSGLIGSGSNRRIGPIGGGGSIGGGGDSSPPSVAITSPSSGQNVSGGITITASASDDIGVAGVQFQIDGSDYGNEDTTNAYSVSLDTTTLTNGQHSITAVARDAAGNTTVSPSTTVSVSNTSNSDTSPPAVSISSPNAGSTVSGTINITANASDDIGVIGIQFLLNGNDLSSEDMSSPYGVSLDTTTLNDGSYLISAIARDAVGNQTTASNITIMVNNGGSSSGGDGNQTILFSESFEDANLQSRGWYDNTNLIISTSEHAPGSNGSVEFRYTQGDTTPTSGGAIRKKFTESDSIYVKFWIKYSDNWVGSNSYSPHEFYILTNKDGDWAGPAYTFMTLHIEQDNGEPIVSIQDSRNIDLNNINVDLSSATENRAVAGCNGDSDGYGDGICYATSNVYRNGKFWRAGQIAFGDTPGAYYKADWHQVEVFVKLNSIQNGKGAADGVIKYWIDGTLLMDFSGVVLRTAQQSDIKFNKLFIAPYMGNGSPIDQSFWVDNLVIADMPPSDTGDTDGGSTTLGPPPTPTGLTISAK